MIKKITLSDGSKHPILMGTEAVAIIEQELDIEHGFEFLNKPENLQSAKNARVIVYAGIKNAYLYNDEPCPLSLERVGALMDVKKLDVYLLTAYATLTDEEIDVEELGDQLKKKTLKKAM